MKRISLFLPSLPLLLFVGVSTLHAEISGYVGANVYQNFWKVGFLDNRTVSNDDASVQFGKAFFIFPVFNGTATVILNRKWISTYSFSYAKPSGDAEISAGSTLRECSGFPCQLVSGQLTDRFTPTLKGTRMDHDLSLGRMLGRTGWSIFAGVKYQYFNMKFDESVGTRTYNYTATFLPSGPTFTAAGSQSAYLGINLTTEAIGPAIGAGYTRELTPWLSVNIQLSYLALFGKATMDNKIRGQTDPGNFLESERTSYVGHGGSTALALVFPLGERILLQLAYRLQAYVTKVTNTATQMKDAYGFQMNQSTNKNPSYIDGAVDIYQGISAGVQYRAF